MTEEPRALSIIYAPEDCPHRDCNNECHHRYNLDNICDYPHEFPDECPLNVVKIIDRNTKIIDLHKDVVNKKHLVAYLRAEIDKANKIIADHGDEELWFDMGYVEGFSDVLWHITKNDGLWAATEPKP